MRADAAEDAEHALHQEGRLDQLALREMSEVVQVTDVVHSNSKRVPFADNAVSAYSISLKVLRKTRSRVLSRCCGSQSCLKALNRFSRGNSANFIEPMFREASSGLKRMEGWMRSSIVMKTAAASEVHDGVGGLVQETARTPQAAGQAGQYRGRGREDGGSLPCLGSLERRVDDVVRRDG